MSLVVVDLVFPSSVTATIAVTLAVVLDDFIEVDDGCVDIRGRVRVSVLSRLACMYVQHRETRTRPEESTSASFQVLPFSGRLHELSALALFPPERSGERGRFRVTASELTEASLPIAIAAGSDERAELIVIIVILSHSDSWCGVLAGVLG